MNYNVIILNDNESYNFEKFNDICVSLLRGLDGDFEFTVHAPIKSHGERFAKLHEHDNKCLCRFEPVFDDMYDVENADWLIAFRNPDIAESSVQAVITEYAAMRKATRKRKEQLYKSVRKKYTAKNGSKKESADINKTAMCVAWWRHRHPYCNNKSQCARDLNLNRRTVDRWWNETRYFIF